ncbi:macro domain-containing protein CT2219-like [Chrysoperla carnea]|uniref:macro domain-containing protein CT2219-like n=1 Tax=Chrysoperla carnea TaxID=189513 RepID=UPI001D0622A7|nr:macro domain-containing protein CT2219-like [Chrysoperla carnea]XP_044728911.1 macro domain-containing protein CT2219-like [Chrysoperla carnea]
MTRWQEEKQRYLELSIEEKRKLYTTKNSTVLSKILPWKAYFEKNEIQSFTNLPKDAGFIMPTLDENRNIELANKVSVWQGDITTLEIDGIVNAANKSLRGGGGVDGAIHRAAGQILLEECFSLNGCETGKAKITGGYMLPARYIIHTVGPIGEKPKLLLYKYIVIQNCYTNCLNLAVENNIKTIGFPSISTGVYGERYPMEKATSVALNAVRTFLQKGKNADKIERVIFVVFSNDDLQTYHRYMQIYFPLTVPESDEPVEPNPGQIKL